MVCVYIVDDDLELGETIKNLIISIGYDSENFIDSASFIAATRRKKPDILLIDMWLGSTTALDVVVKHADLLAGIPAIMMSGGNGKSSLEKVTAIADITGFREILYKPFERDELQAALAKLLKPDGT